MPKRADDEVAAAINEIGGVPAAPVVPEWRWWRWFVPVGDDRIAFVADDEEGWVRLEREAALLARLAQHRLPVPTVLVQSGRHRVQVRRKLPGTCGFAVEEIAFGRARQMPPGERYGARFSITEAGRTLAADLGAVIARIQQAMPADEAIALGWPSTDYVAQIDEVAERLRPLPGLADLHAASTSLRAWLEALPADPALGLRDLQMHNIAIDPMSGSLLGLFDLDEAGVAHRLEDFKYLPSFGIDFTERALAAYHQAGGPLLLLRDVGRMHLLSALKHFLFVPATSTRWQEIVDWSRAALAAQPAW